MVNSAKYLSENCLIQQVSAPHKLPDTHWTQRSGILAAQCSSVVFRIFEIDFDSIPPCNWMVRSLVLLHLHIIQGWPLLIIDSMQPVWWPPWWPAMQMLAKDIFSATTDYITHCVPTTTPDDLMQMPLCPSIMQTQPSPSGYDKKGNSSIHRFIFSSIHGHWSCLMARGRGRPRPPRPPPPWPGPSSSSPPPRGHWSTSWPARRHTLHSSHLGSRSAALPSPEFQLNLFGAMSFIL